MKKPRYDVGYGKPPLHSRFQPGQSGNKKGRPKKTSSFSDIVLEELSALQTIEKDGARIRISTERLIVKQLIRTAAKAGNVRAIEKIMDLRDDGLSRRAIAEREAVRAKQPRLDLSKMTQDELTELYFETIRKTKGG